MRFVYNGVDDLKTLVPDLTEEEIAETDFGTYTADQFFDDMARVTQNRTDPDLFELLVTKSFDTFCWLRDKGVRFIPIYGRQAFKIDGKFKFWGGLTVEAVGGGPGLVEMETEAAKKRGIEIRYATRALSLLFDGVRVIGRARPPRRRRERHPRQGRGARLRRLRGQPGMAHALPRAGLGPRQGARHPLQHRRRPPHGARHRRLRRTATGRAATPCSGR